MLLVFNREALVLVFNREALLLVFNKEALLLVFNREALLLVFNREALLLVFQNLLLIGARKKATHKLPIKNSYSQTSHKKVHRKYSFVEKLHGCGVQLHFK